VEAWLASHPVRSADDAARLEAELARLRREAPLVADASVDLVVSNCVLNLVEDAEKRRLVHGIARVLRPGGRVAVSDIVSDRPVPAHLKADPELWSGCVSGAFREEELLAELARAGLEDVAVAERATEPFAAIEGIDFRSVTVTGRRPGAAEDAAQDGAGDGRRATAEPADAPAGPGPTGAGRCCG